MKKIIVSIVFILSICTILTLCTFFAGAQTTAAFDSLPQLKNYTGPATIATIKETGRGGTFHLKPLNGHALDNGIWIGSAANKTSAWVRDTSGSKAINIQWFGGVGGGIATYKSDSAALTNAVNYINAKGGGALYLPATASFYGYIGLGLPLKLNFEVFGDGAKTNIRCINPNYGEEVNYHGTIFFTGTLGVPRNSGMFRNNIKTMYAYDVPRFQKFIKLRNIKNAANFNNWIGRGFIIGSNVYLKNNSEIQPRFSRGEVNSVVGIGHDTLYLKYPASNRYQADTGYVTLKIVDGTTSTRTWNDTPDFLGQNIRIHDLTLSQAISNEINGQPYKWNTRMGNPIQMGEVYEGEVYNVVFQGYGMFGGNMFNQFKFHNNIVNTSKKCLDVGYNTNNFSYYDNVVNLSKSSVALDTSELAAFYMNEGSGNISIYNNVFNGGTWSGLNGIQIAGGMKYLTMHDNTYNFPNYKENNRTWMLIKDEENDSAYVHDVNIYNETYNFGYAKSYISARLKGHLPRKRNIVFNNVKFNGSIVQAQHTYPVIMINCGNLKLTNVTFKEGDTLDIALDDDAQISGLNATKSYVQFDKPGVGNVQNLNVKGTLIKRKNMGRLKQRN